MVFLDHPAFGDGSSRGYLRAHRREAFRVIGSGVAGGARSLAARLAPDSPAVGAEPLPLAGWTPDADEDDESEVA